jgi:hypothetical protein
MKKTERAARSQKPEAANDKQPISQENGANGQWLIANGILGA